MCNLDRSHIVKPSLFRGGDTGRRTVGGGVVVFVLGGLSFPRLLAVDLIKFNVVAVVVVFAVGVLFVVGVRGFLGGVVAVVLRAGWDTWMVLFAAV
jgi:hypothetical protein